MGGTTTVYNVKNILGVPLEYLLDLLSEKSTICKLVSDGTNFGQPSRNNGQLLQIDVKHFFGSHCILIYTYISLFKDN